MSFGGFSVIYTDTDSNIYTVPVECQDLLTGKAIGGNAGSNFNAVGDGLMGAVMVNALAGTSVSFNFGCSGSPVFEIQCLMEQI